MKKTADVLLTDRPLSSFIRAVVRDIHSEYHRKRNVSFCFMAG